MRGKNIRFMPVLILKILCSKSSTNTGYNPDTVYSQSSLLSLHEIQPLQTDPLDLSNNKNVQSTINERQNEFDYGIGSNISAAVNCTTKKNDIHNYNLQDFTAAQNEAPIQESQSPKIENIAKRKISEDINPKRFKVHSQVITKLIKIVIV